MNNYLIKTRTQVMLRSKLVASSDHFERNFLEKTFHFFETIKNKFYRYTIQETNITLNSAINLNLDSVPPPPTTSPKNRKTISVYLTRCLRSICSSAEPSSASWPDANGIGASGGGGIASPGGGI